ncbi:MAG: hypothetical protein KAR23_02400 [Candidatus Aenigmarchaeota archaeon]|nr:hypothetical protein [Candidatus Aenigmarchaeota archaeon]
MKIEINVERKQFVVLSVLLLIAAISFTASVVSVVGNMVIWHPLDEISADGGVTDITNGAGLIKVSVIEQSSGSGLDADTVDSFHASPTPTPSYLLVLDAGGKIPLSALPSVSIPAGMIAMFNTSCPSGWTRFSALDGRVTKGAVAYGGIGGSDTHTHSYGTRRATCSGGTCHYTSATSVGVGDSWPPYLEVIWCQKD